MLDVREFHKNDITIPKWIFSYDKFKIEFSRGFVDSDGCLTFKKRYKKVPYYPVINIANKNEKMIKGVQTILDDLSFNFTTHKRIDNRDRY